MNFDLILLKTKLAPSFTLYCNIRNRSYASLPIALVLYSNALVDSAGLKNIHIWHSLSYLFIYLFIYFCFSAIALKMHELILVLLRYTHCHHHHHI